MPHYDEKKPPSVTISTSRPRSASGDSTTIKTPRTARFAEATTVYSPVEPTQQSKSPFADLSTNHYQPQPQPADVGFGYLNKPSHESVEMEEDTDRKYLPPPTPRSPLKSPLKSALKSPGGPPKDPLSAIRSPTFLEEQTLEKAELSTEKEQVRDLKSKMQVRAAKFFLRGVNFSCSLIVLSMLTTTFTIFNATKNIPPRNNLPPWALTTNPWPQVVLLCISCVSLFMCVLIFYGYHRGGYRRAEKVAVYYTSFAVLFFCFSIIMWGLGAAVLSTSRTNGNGQDLWGWSCKENRRRDLFQQEINYALVCRLQNWSLVCCVVEVVIEILTIMIYGVTFFRYYSKRRLRKSMARRDTARSDLYLAQLRSQSAPNTPGLGPTSPRSGGWIPPAGHQSYYGSKVPLTPGKEVEGSSDSGSEREGVQYATVPTPRTFNPPAPFSLQPPPIKIHTATPRLNSEGFSPITQLHPAALDVDEISETVNHHAPLAAGESHYASVQIPGSYASPLNSPGFAATHAGGPTPVIGGFDFGLQGRR